ncbi:hypothetical protein DPMN_104700 [Dreissena polymorpha]|uniref:Uncharacterized protein n=1 Tax=Dreissena polymorpha TaxID=45954 RepID=A0A9D4HCH5_DREPO|nr:hypothetical protein DPMN_104700 [Dreissena polymorpha]
MDPEEPALPTWFQDVRPLKRKDDFSPLPSTMPLPLSPLDKDQRYVLPRSIGKSQETFPNLPVNCSTKPNTIHGPYFGSNAGTGSGHEDTTFIAYGLCSHTSVERTSGHLPYRTG